MDITLYYLLIIADVSIINENDYYKDFSNFEIVTVFEI